MQYSPALKWLLTLMIFTGAYHSYGQKACKVRRGTGTSSVNRPSSVFIQITDETRGRVVTYEKEFPLDHVPASEREKYVDALIDQLTGSTDDDRFVLRKSNTTAKKNNVVRRQRDPVVK